jgi:hypothetical protein
MNFMAEKTGRPDWLAPLETKISKAFPGLEAQTWRQEMSTAIPEGLPEAVFNRIRDRFLHDMLAQQMVPLVSKGDTAVNGVVSLFERRLRGEIIAQRIWRSAARDALAASARLHYEGYPASAASAAAYAAYVRRPAEAAASAVEFAAYAADRDAVYRWAARHLLELIRAEVATWEAAGMPA